MNESLELDPDSATYFEVEYIFLLFLLTTMGREFEPGS